MQTRLKRLITFSYTIYFLLFTTVKISELLLKIDLFEFITKNKQLSTAEYLLSCRGKTSSLNNLMAEQLNIYPKAQYKIPQFVDNHCWFTTKSYEQSSSQTSAIFKSTLVKGDNFLDLSGGLGVDDWAFSKVYSYGVSLDPDDNLNELVRINFNKLGVTNCERLDSSAEVFLKTNTKIFDLIYLDADRRTASKKSFLLTDGSPDYLGLAGTLFLQGKHILLKLSPLVDIQYLIKNIDFLQKIYVVSVDHEVKEILTLIKPGSKRKLEIHAVELNDENKAFRFSAEPVNEILVHPHANPKYFFEPAPSIIKSGMSIAYANSLKLNQLAKNTAFYIGLNWVPDFMGRVFEIQSGFEFSKSKLKHYLKTNQIEKANITKRNFNLSVEEIRKLFKLKEGGADYLFFGTNQDGKRMVYHVKSETRRRDGEKRETRKMT